MRQAAMGNVLDDMAIDALVRAGIEVVGELRFEDKDMLSTGRVDG